MPTNIEDKEQEQGQDMFGESPGKGKAILSSEKEEVDGGGKTEQHDAKLDYSPSNPDSDSEEESERQQQIQLEVEELNGLKELQNDVEEINEKRLYELQFFDWERRGFGTPGICSVG
jgi:hypothetical protein